MNDYTYLSPRGIKHSIGQKHIEEAYRLLILAGFEMAKAHDEALDYVIHRINVDELPMQDAMYSNHDQRQSSDYCSKIAAFLEQRKISYTKTKHI